MPDYSDIIERLEKANGPDREIDRLIAVSLGWTFQKMKGDAKSYWRKPDETAFYMRSDLPNFTGSIEVAKTLFPKWASFELTESAAGPPTFTRARLWDWRRAPLMSDPDNEWKSEGNRPLEINACIAALKARAALAGEERG